MIFRKYEDFMPLQRYGNMFDSHGFTYVIVFSLIIRDLPRFHHHIFRLLFKTLGHNNLFGPPEFANNILKIDSKNIILLEDNNLMLPKFHFMLSGKCWYHILDFGEILKRIVIICRCPSFPKFDKTRESRMLTYETITVS